MRISDWSSDVCSSDLSRLRTPEEFRRILLRTNPDGSNVYLSDVARVELGSENYSFQARYNGKPAAGFRISLAPGANALDTVDAEIGRASWRERVVQAG